jgi:hypothetical protein
VVDRRALLERHVELFNEAVRTGDYAPLLSTFAEDAVMTFGDLPIGPFHGRAAIADACTTATAVDSMALIGMEEVGDDAVNALFEWDEGGTGQMFLRWNGGSLAELTITVTA